AFAEKDRVMREFKAGAIHILVSTTVIEVGIDVPNASVMLIEHAERFGLSQLHQLRGRVGRGPWKSYCILLSGGASEDARRRLDAMTATSRGFKSAGAARRPPPPPPPSGPRGRSPRAGPGVPPAPPASRACPSSASPT